MSESNVPIVQLKRNGGAPQIKLLFGFAQFAKFRILLWDTNGHNPTPVATGDNLPGSPDTFPVGFPAADLDGRLITWQASIVSPTGSAGQQYSQTATFLQDEANCLTGPFTQTGPLTNSKTTFANAKFQVLD
jgi:hypothetical protein